MNIRNMPRYTRQPRSLTVQEKQLVFTYPILIDQSLQQYSDLVRDFFAIVFTGEIKIANILHVVSTTFKTTRYPKLNQGQFQNTQSNQNIQSDNLQIQFNQKNRTVREGIDRYALNEYIKEQLQLISKFIKTNPRYKRLRPCVSTITIPGSQFVTIPMIIGTYPYFTDTDTLYWILMFAIGFGLSLDKPSNFTKIVNYMKSFDARDYYYLIFTEQGRKRIEKNLKIAKFNSPEQGGKYIEKILKIAKSNSPDDKKLNSALENVMSRVFDDVQKTNTFFSIALDAHRWDRYNGVLSTRDVFTTTIQNISPQYMSNLNQAESFYSSYISDEIVNILESYINIMEPAIASSRGLIVDLLNDLNSVSDFGEIGKLVIDSLQTNTRANAGQSIIDMLSSFCKQISSYDVNKLLDIKHEVLASYTRYDDVIDFHNEIEKLGSSLYQLSTSLITNLTKIVETKTNDISRYFKSVYNNLRQLFLDVFLSENPKYGKLLEHPSINTHPRWAFASSGQNRPISDSEFNQLIQIATEGAISLANITYFLYVISFVTFLCKSIDKIKLEFETIKKDATDWPNYCLVMPLDVIIGLYAAQHAINFKKILSDPSEAKSIYDKYDNWSASETQTKRMINFMANRLAIPNIILIDKKSNTCFYKFMFMESCEKIRLNTMSTYIKNQHDLLIVK